MNNRCTKGKYESFCLICKYFRNKAVLLVEEILLLACQLTGMGGHRLFRGGQLAKWKTEAEQQEVLSMRRDSLKWGMTLSVSSMDVILCRIGDERGLPAFDSRGERDGPDQFKYINT